MLIQYSFFRCSIHIPLLGLKKEDQFNNIITNCIIFSGFLYLLEKNEALFLLSMEIPVLYLVFINKVKKNEKDLQERKEEKPNPILQSIDFNKVYKTQLETKLKLDFSKTKPEMYNLKKLSSIFNIINGNNKIANKIFITEGNNIKAFANYKNNNINGIIKQIIESNLYQCYQYHYKNNYFNNNNSYHISFFDFNKDIKSIDYFNKEFNIKVKLDSISVIARYIIIFAILKIILEKNLVNIMLHFLLQMILYSFKYSKFYTLTDTFVNYKITSVISKGFINAKLPLELFEVKYKYIFLNKKLKRGVNSDFFFIKGQKHYITIYNVSIQKYQNFFFVAIFQKYINDINLEILKNIEDIMRNFNINPKIPSKYLISVIHEELNFMINSGINHTLNFIS